MADTFRSMGPASMSWLEIMTGIDSGVVAYDADLQKAVLANHAALDTLFPSGVDPTKFNFTSTTATLHSPPVDEDEDSEVAQAIVELQNLLRACKARNSPASVLSPSAGQYPSSVFGMNDDLDTQPGDPTTAAAMTLVVNVF